MKHAAAQQQPAPPPQAIESAEDNNGRDVAKSFEKTYESAAAARHRGVRSIACFSCCSTGVIAGVLPSTQG